MSVRTARDLERNEAKRQKTRERALSDTPAAETEQAIAHHKDALAPFVERSVAHAAKLATYLPGLGSPDEDIVLNFINLVREDPMNPRYPLTSSSPEWQGFKDKPETVRCLAALVQSLGVFDFDSVPPEILSREEDEAAEGGDEEDGDEGDEETEEESGDDSQDLAMSDDTTESEEDSVVFQFYTRATPEQDIDGLLAILEVIDQEYPSNHIWVQVQTAYLHDLKACGHETARILYSGYTTKTPRGREVEDSEKVASASSLLCTWKRISGQPLEVYRWPELEVTSKSKLDFRTSKEISGREEVIVDAVGGPLLALNQHPGGFATLVKYHPSLIAVQQRIERLSSKDFAYLTTKEPQATLATKEARDQRISNLMQATSEMSAAQPRSVVGVVAQDDVLASITKWASSYELKEGEKNAPRAHIRKDIPREALTVPNTTYGDTEVGRGATTDQQIDRGAFGAIDPATGEVLDRTSDHRFPFLDLWCVTEKHPDGWIFTQVLILVLWLTILDPKIVILGAAKILSLALRGTFSTIFRGPSIDPARLTRVWKEVFTTDHPFNTQLLGEICNVPFPPLPNDRGILDLNQAQIFEEFGKSQKALWRSLQMHDYMTHVGGISVVQYGPFDHAWRVTLAVLDGGCHAYKGTLRPFTMVLSQAAALLQRVAEIVTADIVVDGSHKQALAIQAAIKQAAVETGLSKALEDLRTEALHINTAVCSLVSLGTSKRQRASLTAEERAAKSERLSRLMSAKMQKLDSSAVTAEEDPGSTERLDQVVKILQANRDRIDRGNLTTLVPCPSWIAAGPGCLTAFLWYVFDVPKGQRFNRAAWGGARQTVLPTDAQAFQFAKKQLQHLKTSRNKGASFTSATFSRATVIDRMNGIGLKNGEQKSVWLLECRHCPWKGFVKKDNRYENGFRHACPKKKGAILDLRALEETVKALEKAQKQSTVSQKISKAVETVKQSNSERVKRWSRDGEGALWTDLKTDQALTAMLESIKTGSVTESGLAAKKMKEADKDRSEKHGRLIFADMKRTAYTQKDKDRLPVIDGPQTAAT